MKRLFTLLLTTAFLSAQVFGSTAFAREEDLHELLTQSNINEAYVPDEILVRFHNDSKPFHTIKVPPGQVQKMIALYNNNPNVVYAEPNYYAKATVNDPYFSYQWNLGDQSTGGINAELAWTLSTGSGVVVAILDTGIAYENYGGRYKIAPDLKETSFVQGYDFINNDAHPNDDNGHGTHVAGTIAQSTNNSVGVAGVAHDASLMPVKVLNSAGSGSYQAIANGIYYAVDNGAKVINMSLGGSVGSQTLLDALVYAYVNNVTVVAATGNDEHGPVSYPAAYDDYVIGVGATRYDKGLAYYSNVGPEVDLVAPGGDITVDQNGDGYGDGILQNTMAENNTRSFGYYFYQGTSMATPHVAGVAALLIANGNATTPVTIEQAMTETALDLGTIGFDNSYGYGLVDAYEALLWEGIAPPPPPENDPPTADSQSVNTLEDTSIPILITGTDPEGDPLTFSVNSGPQNGTLSGSGSALTYTPALNYNGPDSFTFIVNDGSSDSVPATVSITVEPVNDKPTTAPINSTTFVDTSVDIPLLGHDVDGDPLVYSVVAGSIVGGTVSIIGNTATFTPEAGSTLDGSFDYIVNDGLLDSDSASVFITVTPAPEIRDITFDITYDLTIAGRKGDFIEGSATVTVYDNGSPLTDLQAVVTGYWLHKPDVLIDVTTDSNGEALFSLRKVKLNSTTLVVTNIQVDGTNYPTP